MSLALYRKYRPATFAELKGQEHVAEPLQQALRNGRINHAYLFSGPRGCGKTSSARILARSLNCEQGPTPDPCGVCDSCVALGPTGSGHIDVIEIDAASHGGVDDARDLRERAFFAPVSARFKVYIIDEAHMVTREGFNALLKLVEEPPPHLKFVFATTEPEKVIGTIRSRTHHYPFRLIPPGTLQELVEEILKSEDVPYETAALPLAVRAGAGSARDTLSILDQLLAGSDEKGITYARAVSLLGYTDSALLDEVIGAFAARDGGAVFAAIDRVVESGQDPRRFTADLLERVRDLVILSNVPEAGGSGLLNVPPDELEQMRRQASSLGPAELTRAADLLHTGLTEMRGATSPRLLLELIAARILLPGAYGDEASLMARLDRLERTAASGGGFGGPGGGGGGQGAPGYGAYGGAAGAGSNGGAGAGAGAAPGAGAASGGGAGSGLSAGAGAGAGGASYAPQQPPPAQGGDPTSSVQRPTGTAEGERGSVDNRAGSAFAGAFSASSSASSESSAASAPSGPSASSGGVAAGSSSVAAGSSSVAAGSSGVASSARADSTGSAAGGSAATTGPGAAGSSSAGSASTGSGSRAMAGPASTSGGFSGAAGSHNASSAPSASASAGQGGGGDVAMVQQRWPEIVDAVKFKSRVAWVSVMNGVRPIGLTGNQLTLAFEAEGALKNFTAGNRDTVLREVLRERLGVDWRIEAVLGGANVPPPGGGRPGSPGGFGGGGGGGNGGGVPVAGFSGASTPAPPPAPGPRPSVPPQSPSVPAPAQPSQQASGSSGSGHAGQPGGPSAPNEGGDRGHGGGAGSGGGRGSGGAGASVPDPGPLPPPPDEPPPPSEPGPPDDIDVVDPEGDADYDGTEAEAGGMALIQRELGGQIIREIDNT
ncbi:DNA polymerase III subunit gamma and tau [Actinomadura logoneensis]|uniref:DNA-directed DNA polymerase n=1 Tax=Actinomadura logoneensis TaxID=2293572 RepID=A0A372JRJ6_9ACTN|nr:DNA polymerase III subunit gamma and tau [Actinomadura logoneensis]RFU42627.1 DNA polymerase III subunit gamma and tau [Actinomadura logoneensis]